MSDGFHHGLSAIVGNPLSFLIFLGLCAPFLQGSLTKICRFEEAITEMGGLGLRPPRLFAIAVIAFELTASGMLLFGYYRGAASFALGVFTFAATLIALRFWELPAGKARIGAMDSFFEHIGLAAAFVLVAALEFQLG